jgi:hypothetical protein
MTTHGPYPQSASRWRRSVASLLLAAVAALGLAPDVTAGPRAKMDRHLRERTSQAADATPFKVIVTLKPGAKRHVVKALKASGYQVGADFTLTEAFAAQLPAGVLRALENDPDVVAISTDAPVAPSGVTTSVTGTAQGSGYSLRHTLGLEAVATVTPGTTTTGTAGSTKTLSLSHTTAAGDNRVLLVGVALFDGSGTKQVSSVTYGSQNLTLAGAIRDAGNQVRAEVWRLIAPPVGTATVKVTLNANSDGFAVGATSFTGVHQTTPVGTVATARGVGSQPALSVTATVDHLVFDSLALKDGGTVTAGWGQTSRWNTVPSSNRVRGAASTKTGASSVAFGWQTDGKEWALVGVPLNRAVTTTTLTGTGVTAAVIDSGLLEDGGGTTRIKTTRDFTGGATSPAAVTATQ